MKTFTEYLTESKKTYNFIIRIAGDLPENCADMIESSMKKFGLVSLSNPKRTPIQEKPLDFPQLQNMEVNTFEAQVNYPTTAHVLERYLSDCCSITHSHITVRGEGDPIEEQQAETDNKPYEAMLNTEDMGGESAQDSVAGNRVMDLLKELETARKERDVDMTGGVQSGDSKDIGESENKKSVVGS